MARTSQVIVLQRRDAISQITINEQGSLRRKRRADRCGEDPAHRGSGLSSGNSSTSRIEAGYSSHHQAIDADAEPCSGRHAVLQRADVVVVEVHRLFVAALLAIRDLRARSARA